MEEYYGEKAEFGETGHFRAGVINPRPGLGRTFGNVDKCGFFDKQGRGIQARDALPCSQRRVRNVAVHDRPVDLGRHLGDAN